MIQFLDGIAVFAPIRSSLELFAHPERVVEHGMRQVEEERFILVALDKSNGLVGVDPGQLVGIGRALDHLAVTHQGDTSLVLEKERLYGIEVMQ